MKKLFYIGVLSSALLLAACGEAEKPFPENKVIKYPIPSEQTKTETEKKVQAEQKTKEEIGNKTENEITVNEVKEIIENDGMGENDKLVSLTIENGEIKAVIDLAPNKLNLSAKDIAVTSYQGASDELLTKEGWNTLTIEFVHVGTISMNKSEKVSNEYGYYFPVVSITEKLKY